MNDAITLNPGARALIPVLKNDQGALIDTNSVTIVGAPAAGTAQAQPGGKVLYTHNGSPGTSDQFTYRIQNLFGNTSAVATVSWTSRSRKDASVAILGALASDGLFIPLQFPFSPMLVLA